MDLSACGNDRISSGLDPWEPACLLKEADFHPGIYDAMPPRQPAIGKHMDAGGLAEKTVRYSPA